MISTCLYDLKSKTTIHQFSYQNVYCISPISPTKLYKGKNNAKFSLTNKFDKLSNQLTDIDKKNKRFNVQYYN